MPALATRRVILWTIAGILGLLLLAAIGMPNLLRSRIAADEAARYSLFNKRPSSGASAALVQDAEAATVDRKLIRNAELELLVTKVNTAVDGVRTVVQAAGGYVEKASFEEESDQQRMAAIVVRVPAAKLDETMVQLKALGARVRRENVEDRDVTHEYIDMEARLRNMRAEEAQYLSIMKRAYTIKDTLEVAGKVQDVRGRIEQLQGEFNYMRGQVDMSTIKIALWPETPMRTVGIQWQPLVHAREALHDTLAGLGDWADMMMAFLIKLPLILIWVVTVSFAIVVLWRVGRRVWRLIAPAVAVEVVSIAPEPPRAQS